MSATRIAFVSTRRGGVRCSGTVAILANCGSGALRLGASCARQPSERGAVVAERGPGWRLLLPAGSSECAAHASGECRY